MPTVPPARGTEPSTARRARSAVLALIRKADADLRPHREPVIRPLPTLAATSWSRLSACSYGRDRGAGVAARS
ncbi:hypothetical protein C1I97_20755 [Streptomyces sp. NTH33]|nr:hypothetical protein C1I97_20755 [Streptomyces sp. NTH33]